MKSSETEYPFYVSYLTEVQILHTRRIITILLCTLALNSVSADFAKDDIVVLQYLNSHGFNGAVGVVTEGPKFHERDGTVRCSVKLPSNHINVKLENMILLKDAITKDAENDLLIDYVTTKNALPSSVGEIRKWVRGNKMSKTYIECKDAFEAIP